VIRKVIDGVMIGVKMIGFRDLETQDSMKRKKGVDQIAQDFKQSINNVDVTGAFNSLFGFSSGATSYGGRSPTGNLVPQNTCSRILEYILQW